MAAWEGMVHSTGLWLETLSETSGSWDAGTKAAGISTGLNQWEKSGSGGGGSTTSGSELGSVTSFEVEVEGSGGSATSLSALPAANDGSRGIIPDSSLSLLLSS